MKAAANMQVQEAQEALERANAIAAAASALNQSQPHTRQQRARRVQLYDAAREREEREERELATTTGVDELPVPTTSHVPASPREDALVRPCHPATTTSTPRGVQVETEQAAGDRARTGRNSLVACFGVYGDANREEPVETQGIPHHAKPRSSLMRTTIGERGSGRGVGERGSRFDALPPGAMPPPTALPAPSPAWRNLRAKDVIATQASPPSQQASPPPRLCSPLLHPPVGVPGSGRQALPLPAELPPPSSEVRKTSPPNPGALGHYELPPPSLEVRRTSPPISGALGRSSVAGFCNRDERSSMGAALRRPSIGAALRRSSVTDSYAGGESESIANARSPLPPPTPGALGHASAAGICNLDERTSIGAALRRSSVADNYAGGEDESIANGANTRTLPPPPTPDLGRRSVRYEC